MWEFPTTLEGFVNLWIERVLELIAFLTGLFGGTI